MHAFSVFVFPVIAVILGRHRRAWGLSGELISQH
jgi:hypothetical protein